MLLIAALTPAEYETVDVPVRVQKVKQIGSAIEVLLDGSPKDATYVRDALEKRGNVETTEPKQLAGVSGILMSFRAMGTRGQRLTKAAAIKALRQDPWIEVMANA